MQKSWLNKNFEKAVSGLPKNPIVIEVGSHKGDGVTFIKKKRPNATVYAIEPCSETFERLRRVAINAYNCAIVGKNNDVLLRRKGNSRQYRIETNNGERVEAKTLSEFIARAYISKIDLLRFDCYGSEYEIFQGDTSFLDITSVVCLTLHKQRVCDKKYNVKVERKKIEKTLNEAGFTKTYHEGKTPQKHWYQLWVKF